MQEFLKSFLEPVSYLIYAILVYCYTRIDKSGRYKLLLGYYVFATLFLLVAQWLKDNNWAYNLFFFLTAVFFSYFYHSILPNPVSKRIVLLFCSFNILLFLINDIFYGQIFTEDNYARSFYFFTIIIYSLLYLYQTIKEVNESNILEQFDFWLVSGYLLYFLGCLCIVLYYKYQTVEQRGELWILHSVILFCSSIITGAGTLWLLKQKRIK